jgi:hypothetical protein
MTYSTSFRKEYIYFIYTKEAKPSALKKPKKNSMNLPTPNPASWGYGESSLKTTLESKT